jgi:DNA polymerase-3 subunit gamma/tau
MAPGQTRGRSRMSYQVIARKYRPQRFADVVGQEHVTTTLANAIRAGRIAHAYLFCGPRGTGKTTIARIFAKCLNCTDGPKVDFDDADPRCVEIAEGRSLDVLEIDGASNNGVEQVRELRETCKFAPATSRFKIYIIDEVHMLTAAAFNALLKTLEEPPAHVKFLFATTDPEKVLPTILSRCQRFDLRRIPAALIVKHLAAIAAREGVQVEEAALHAIARGADGGMRDAESTLDQLISFCGHTIVEADVLSMFGLAARDQLLGLTDALLDGDAARVLQTLDELARGGKDLGRLLGDLLHHFRNLLVFQVSRGDAGLLEVSEAELAALRRQAERVGPDTVTRMLEVLTDAEGRLRDALSRKIALEVALLKAIQARHAVSLDAVLSQLQALRAEANGAAGSGNPLAPAAAPPVAPAVAAPAPASRPHPAPPATAAPAQPAPALQETAADTPAATAPADGISLAGVPADLAALWAALLAEVREKRRFLHSYLLKAFPVACEREQLTIGFPPAGAQFIPLVDAPQHRELILAALRTRGWREPRLKFVQAEPPEGSSLATPGPVPTPAAAPSESPPEPPAAEPAPPANGKAASAPLDPEKFKDDPLIKQALEIFKGRIARVIAPAPPAA